jgi:hypothetical protein
MRKLHSLRLGYASLMVVAAMLFLAVSPADVMAQKFGGRPHKHHRVKKKKMAKEKSYHKKQLQRLHKHTLSKKGMKHGNKMAHRYDHHQYEMLHPHDRNYLNPLNEMNNYNKKFRHYYDGAGMHVQYSAGVCYLDYPTYDYVTYTTLYDTIFHQQMNGSIEGLGISGGVQFDPYFSDKFSAGVFANVYGGPMFGPSRLDYCGEYRAGFRFNAGWRPFKFLWETGAMGYFGNGRYSFEDRSLTQTVVQYESDMIYPFIPRFGAGIRIFPYGQKVSWDLLYYADLFGVTGPDNSKTLNRPKLSVSHVFSTSVWMHTRFKVVAEISPFHLRLSKIRVSEQNFATERGWRLNIGLWYTFDLWSKPYNKVNYELAPELRN